MQKEAAEKVRKSLTWSSSNTGCTVYRSWYTRKWPRKPNQSVHIFVGGGSNKDKDNLFKVITQEVVAQSPEPGAHDTSVWQKKKTKKSLSYKTKKKLVNNWGKVAKNDIYLVYSWLIKIMY